MRFLFLSEYPPLASASAAQGYWLAQFLKQAGMEVYVVSDGWHAGRDYRANIVPDDFCYLNSNNPRYFSIDPIQGGRFGAERKPHIPRLISLAMEVFEQYGFDLIYTNSLITYGTAASVIKEITKRPLIVSHYNRNLGLMLHEPYLAKYMQYVVNNADLVLGTFDQIDIYKQLGVSRIIEGVPLGVVQSSENEIEALSLPVKEDLPMVVLWGNVDNVQGSRYCINLLEQITSEFNLVLSCHGDEFTMFKDLIDKSKFKGQYVDIGVLPPWRQVSLIKKASIIIPTALVNLTSSLDSNLFYQIMSLGKAPVVTKRLTEICSHLVLNSMNSIIVQDDLEEVISNVLKEPMSLAEMGVRAKAAYEKIEQSKILDILRRLNGSG